MGGGGFSMEPDNPLLDDHVLELARAGRGRDRPRVCFLPTASGDLPGYVANFYAALARRSEATHLALFDRTVTDLEAFLCDQDVVYVGGGNTENMLAVWRVHGVDRALRRAWEAGTVMTGLSAGSLCWFETGTTDSFGRARAAVRGAWVRARQPCPALRRRGGPPGALPGTGREGHPARRLRGGRRSGARLPRPRPRRGGDLATRRAGLPGRAGIGRQGRPKRALASRYLG